VGPRAGLDSEVRGKILCLCRGSDLDRPVVQSVVKHCTDGAILGGMPHNYSTAYNHFMLYNNAESID
jgi:hypothetical protein